MEIAAQFGVSRSHLGKKIDAWIFRLGDFAKKTLVGIPDMQYILDNMPHSFIDAGMDKVVAIGDCCDIDTETVRTTYMAQVKNQMFSDKVQASAARGCSFCTPTGLTIIALGLVLGRASELNCVRALRPEFHQIPGHCHLCYDKGVPGMRCCLPHFNHVWMPAFLAPARGKTKFTREEHLQNRAVARNRYVIEICYSRAKDWQLLGSYARRETFHLLDSTWFWALGFSNLCCDHLQPPPDVETEAHANGGRGSGRASGQLPLRHRLRLRLSRLVLRPLLHLPLSVSDALIKYYTSLHRDDNVVRQSPCPPLPRCLRAHSWPGCPPARAPSRPAATAAPAAPSDLPTAS